MNKEEIIKIINERLDYFMRGHEQGFVSRNSLDDMRYFAGLLIQDVEEKFKS